MDFNLTPILNGLYQHDERHDFGIKLSDRAAYGTPEHVHSNIQVSIPLGETVIEARWRTSDGALHSGIASRGHVLIIPPGQRHAVGWRKRAIFANLHIGASSPLDDDLHRLLAVVAKVGETHLVHDPFLSDLGENVLLLASNRITLDAATMRTIRLMIIAHIVKTYAPDRISNEPLDGGGSSLLADRRVIVDADPLAELADESIGRAARASTRELARWQLRKVTSAIEADLRYNRSVGELAAMINLSKGHFSRAFRASTGLSPRQWIIERRVKAATEKLAASDEPLAEISASCGFSEQSHFTRTFTQVTGMSPGAWRRAYKG